MIRLTIQINPGKISKGMMVIFVVKVEKLTREIRLEIEKGIHQVRSEQFWVSWQVVDRPIIILAFQAQSVNEMRSIQEDIMKTISNIQSFSYLIGGKMRYFPDFTDELLEKNV